MVGKILKWWRNIGRPDKVDKQIHKRSKFKSSKRRLRFDRNRNSVIVRNEKKHKWYSWIWLAVRKKNKHNCSNFNNNNNNNNSLCLRDETDKEAMAKVTKVEPGDSSSCKYQILWCCMFCLVLVFSVYWLLSPRPAGAVLQHSSCEKIRPELSQGNIGEKVPMTGSVSSSHQSASQSFETNNLFNCSITTV